MKKNKKLELLLGKYKLLVRAKQDKLNDLYNENHDLKLAYNLISAELRVEKINSQALVSCEKANDLMHDKLECYRVVLKDLN